MGLMRDGGSRVGLVLAGLVSFINPTMIVIGGGLAGLGQQLLAEIRGVVFHRSLPFANGDLPIVLSELGPSAGVTGAAAMIPATTSSPSPSVPSRGSFGSRQH